jgi:putrescine importer
VVTQFASGIAAQASTSRLLYAMGRDSVLPRKMFGYIHPRFRTPALNILLTGAVGLLALRLSVTTSTSFINFGAFTAFTFVNLSVIATFIRERRSGRTPGLVPYVIAPAIGAAIDGWLLVHLDGKALMLGLIWLVLGLVYLAFLTRGFRAAPPEMKVGEDPKIPDAGARR